MRKSRIQQFPATHWLPIAAAAAVDLRASSGQPPYEAERLTALNSTAGALVLAVTGIDGVARTVSIPAQSYVTLEAPFASVQVGNACPLIAYWWHDGIAKLNP